jgi:hypothetical protein
MPDLFKAIYGTAEAVPLQNRYFRRDVKPCALQVWWVFGLHFVFLIQEK